MKRLICLLIALAVLSVPVFATEAVTVGWTVADEKVRPGGQTTIQLTLSNPSAAATPQYINLYITSGPYLTVTPTSASIASLGPGASQQTVLDVRVSENAVSTTSYVTVKVTYTVSGSSRDTTVKIPIKIRRNPILQIKNVSFDKTPEPGVSTILSFDIVNSGEGPAEELKVLLNQTTTLASTDSTGEIIVSSLGPAGKEHVEFPITINPDAEPGIYSIPLTLSYYDETKSDLSRETKSIGLTLTGTAKFIITLDRTEDFYFGRKGTAYVSISNVGTVPAEFLTVKASSEFGTKEIYVGSLDPDDTEVTDIEQDLARATGPYQLSLELSWKDKFGTQHTETRQLGLSPTSAPIEISITTIFLFLVVFGGAVWLYKKRQKK